MLHRWGCKILIKVECPICKRILTLDLEFSKSNIDYETFRKAMKFLLDAQAHIQHHTYQELFDWFIADLMNQIKNQLAEDETNDSSQLE